MNLSKKLLSACLSTLFVLSQPFLNADDLQHFNVHLDDCQSFPSNFSLAPEEVYYALKYATYKDTFNVLEFGAGEGTIRLVELLQKQKVPYDYHTFENALEYVFTLPNVTFHYYQLPPVDNLYKWRPVIQSLEMPELPIADLVIVDGPHGVSRADWYAKFKHLTRPGTVIIIDDFHHYSEFGKELDKNFDYETIVEYHHNGSHHLVNDGLDPIDWIVHKCFKIVRVIQSK